MDAELILAHDASIQMRVSGDRSHGSSYEGDMRSNPYSMHSSNGGLPEPGGSE